mmetsp:Transcript_1157/g.3340  ORF Transcript_1157/g.3340 Transcript_1157/m.3340 type:complete len:407 (+) Transcript_1157:134-1354(+)
MGRFAGECRGGRGCPTGQPDHWKKQPWPRGGVRAERLLQHLRHHAEAEWPASALLLRLGHLPHGRGGARLGVRLRRPRPEHHGGVGRGAPRRERGRLPRGGPRGQNGADLGGAAPEAGPARGAVVRQQLRHPDAQLQPLHPGPVRGADREAAAPANQPVRGVQRRALLLQVLPPSALPLPGKVPLPARLRHVPGARGRGRRGARGVLHQGGTRYEPGLGRGRDGAEGEGERGLQGRSIPPCRDHVHGGARLGPEHEPAGRGQPRRQRDIVPGPRRLQGHTPQHSGVQPQGGGLAPDGGLLRPGPGLGADERQGSLPARRRPLAPPGGGGVPRGPAEGPVTDGRRGRGDPPAHPAGDPEGGAHEMIAVVVQLLHDDEAGVWGPVRAQGGEGHCQRDAILRPGVGKPL